MPNEIKEDKEKVDELMMMFKQHSVEGVVRDEELKIHAMQLIRDGRIGVFTNFFVEHFYKLIRIEKPVFDICDKILDGTLSVIKNKSHYKFVDIYNDVEFDIVYDNYLNYSCDKLHCNNAEFSYIIDCADTALHREEMRPKREFREKIASIYCKED